MPRLAGALSCLIKWKVSLLTSGGWRDIILISLPTQIHVSVILLEFDIGSRVKGCVSDKQEKVTTWNGAVM